MEFASSAERLTPEDGTILSPHCAGYQIGANETCPCHRVYLYLEMVNCRTLIACCALGSAGCPTVDLGDTPADIAACNPAGGMAYFVSDIQPKFFKLPDPGGCAKSASCHDQAHGLTLDRVAPVDDVANYRVTQSYLNCGSPMASRLLTKPLAGVDGHGGGDIFPGLNDAAVQTFIMWFQ